MNDKILQKLLKSIGKIIVKASTANCCCVNCVPSIASAEDCATAGGTFFQGSNCTEFLGGNCCKNPVSGQNLLVIRNDPVRGRFVMNGDNQHILVLSTGVNMPSCGMPVVTTRLPCCRKWVNKRCSIFIIDFPRISSPREWRGREGPHQCRTVLIQTGDPSDNSDYMVVCTPVTPQ